MRIKLREGDLRIEGEKITEIGEDLSDGEVLDLSGRYILPGFIDTHIDGAYGTRLSGDKDVDLSKTEAGAAGREHCSGQMRRYCGVG